MRFEAAVLRKANTPLQIETLRMRDVNPGEVLVRLQAAGVCHTDYEAMSGSFKATLPIVLGHEGAGIVEAIGADVRNVRVGDHVVCTIYPNCGGCFYCRRTLPMLCEGLPSGRTSMTAQDGVPVHSFLNVSSFAQFCVVPERGAIRIPPQVPFASACLLGCAVITGVGAATRIAKVQLGESVAVVGCGAVGLNVLQGARLAGAQIIIAIDRSASKLERAQLFGATHTLLADQEDLLDQVRNLTAGRGVDHGFEAAGIVGSLQTTFDCTRPGASVTILGKTGPDREIGLRFGSIAAERRILRSSLGGAQAADDFPTYAEAYLEGRILLDEQIDFQIPLTSINDAFDEIAKGDVVRTVITMGDGHVD